MRMDMRSVRVSSNNNFITGNFCCQLQCNLMSDFRCELLTGMEGLDHVIVHPPIRILMKPLGVHEFLQCKLWNAVHTTYQ